MDPGRRRLTPVVSSRQRRWLVRCATTHRRGGCERVPNRPISTCPQPKLDDLSFGPTQVCWRDRKAIWAFTTAEPGMPTANRPRRRGYPNVHSSAAPRSPKDRTHDPATGCRVLAGPRPPACPSSWNAGLPGHLLAARPIPDLPAYVHDEVEAAPDDPAPSSSSDPSPTPRRHRDRRHASPRRGRAHRPVRALALDANLFARHFADLLQPQPGPGTAGLSTCVTASRSSAGAAASSAARVAWQPAQPPR